MRKSILRIINAKEKGFDSIVLAIKTDTEQTYYINDTEDGFSVMNVIIILMLWILLQRHYIMRRSLDSLLKFVLSRL